MNQFIHLIEALIWPITILIILYWFRKEFRSNLGRLQSFDASASGVSIAFSERLEKAKKMAKTLTAATAKSGSHIHVTQKPGYQQQLKKMATTVHEKLVSQASTSSIDVTGLSTIDLSSALVEIGSMQFEEAQLINTFTQLCATAQDDLTDEQFRDIQSIFKVITK